VIETLAEARDTGMRITARCGWGRREARKTHVDERGGLSLSILGG